MPSVTLHLHRDTAHSDSQVIRTEKSQISLRGLTLFGKKNGKINAWVLLEKKKNLGGDHLVVVLLCR